MRKMKPYLLFFVGVFLSSCHQGNQNTLASTQSKIKQLTPELIQVRDYVPKDAVIAHRGTTYWAPESTEAAYRWARNIGADYLEADLQLTKDGVILVLHDNKLTRTTNIQEVYPDRANDPTSTFTYEELMKLDAGTWFNSAPNTSDDRKRESFSQNHQYISTLEDLINFAEGKKLKRDASGERVWKKDSNGKYIFEYEQDLQDNGNRPGIYLETKEPHLNPGIENKLNKQLTQLNWNIITKPEKSTARFLDGKINVGKTQGKVVLQTFSRKSLSLLKDEFHGKIPSLLLLWKGDGKGEDDMVKSDKETYISFINYAVDNLAQFIGPSIAGGTVPDNYDELLEPWQANLIHSAKMHIHPYSFDTQDQMQKYQSYSNGMFTNQSDKTIQFYQTINSRKEGTSSLNAMEVLDYLGY